MDKQRFFNTDWIDEIIEGYEEYAGCEYSEKEKDHIRAKAVNDMIDAFGGYGRGGQHAS